MRGGSHPTVSLIGTSTGSFDLDVHEVSGNIIVSSSTFAVIPSATSTKASISFHRGGIDTASPLIIDYNGDGKHVMSLKGKKGETIVPDNTPKKVREFLKKRGHKVTSPHEKGVENDENKVGGEIREDEDVKKERKGDVEKDNEKDKLGEMTDGIKEELN